MTGSEERHHDSTVDRFLKAHDIGSEPEEAGELAPVAAMIEYTARSALWGICPPEEPMTPIVRTFGMIALLTIASSFCQRLTMDDGSPVDRDEVVSYVAGNVIGVWPSEDPAWEAVNIAFQPAWLEVFHGGYQLWARLEGCPRSYAAIVELFDRVGSAYLDPDDPELFNGLLSLTVNLFEALNEET